jgi:hypothetical protein
VDSPNLSALSAVATQADSSPAYGTQTTARPAAPRRAAPRAARPFERAQAPLKAAPTAASGPSLRRISSHEQLTATARAPRPLYVAGDAKRALRT